jgi:hypothetical protein
VAASLFVFLAEGRMLDHLKDLIRHR